MSRSKQRRYVFLLTSARLYENIDHRIGNIFSTAVFIGLTNSKKVFSVLTIFHSNLSAMLEYIHLPYHMTTHVFQIISLEVLQNTLSPCSIIYFCANFGWISPKNEMPGKSSLHSCLTIVYNNTVKSIYHSPKKALRHANHRLNLFNRLYLS